MPSHAGDRCLFFAAGNWAERSVFVRCQLISISDMVTHRNVLKETAGFSRAEEWSGGVWRLTTSDMCAAIQRPIASNTVCDTLVLVGACPDRAEGTTPALPVDPVLSPLPTESCGFQPGNLGWVKDSRSYAFAYVSNRCQVSAWQGRCKPAVLLGGIRHGGCRARVKPPRLRVR